MKLALVNQSTTVNATQAKQIVAALRIQLKDVAHAWDRKVPTVSYAASEAAIAADADIIRLLDNPDVPGALGYHDLSPSGRPYSNVFTTYNGQAWPVLTGNPCVANIVSHEAAEMVGDPPAGFWSTYNAAGDLVALELCDPVENDTYNVTLLDGTQVAVSDFVLPAWFSPFSPAPYSFLQSVNGPAPKLAAGGYAIVEKSSGERQIFGEIPTWKQGGTRAKLRLAK